MRIPIKNLRNFKSRELLMETLESRELLTVSPLSSVHFAEDYTSLRFCVPLTRAMQAVLTGNSDQ
jgi:hypothetical protein